jgi:hypothetical protein
MRIQTSSVNFIAIFAYRFGSCGHYKYFKEYGVNFVVFLVVLYKFRSRKHKTD